MRTNVTPFLWFVAAVMSFVVWRSKDKGAFFLLLAVGCAILCVRSYRATKKQLMQRQESN